MVWKRADPTSRQPRPDYLEKKPRERLNEEISYGNTYYNEAADWSNWSTGARRFAEPAARRYDFRDNSSGFDGMTEAESQGLLQFLFEHSCRPDFVYRHQWTQGDVLIWDNRCTIHYAVHDYGEAPRIMHRTTIAGDTPRP